MVNRVAVEAALLATGLVTMPAAAAPDDPREAVLATLAARCADGGEVAAGTEEPIVARGRAIGERTRIALAGGARLTVDRIAPGGRLRRIQLELHDMVGGEPRPALLVAALADCRPVMARRIAYGAGGRAEWLEILSPDLERVQARVPVDPPVPAGTDPGGVAVAMVDAGVNYLLPEIRTRLARDRSGEILGRDFWDRDRRPFDASPAHSPFFPQRHGTRTASVLLDEAPVARLVPYRYPRPEMARMANLVEAAAVDGVAIVNLSLGSNRARDWEAFERAARRHPEILFLAAAGNNGRDLDRRPVYPAALDLPNLVVVTSSLGSGRLAAGSNWGRTAVDLLVPGENMLVLGFDGRRRLASGSSYAVVRVSALAACLLAAHPGWRAPELKRALFERAERIYAGSHLERVAVGFLPDPDREARGACPAATREVTSLLIRELDAAAIWGGPAPPGPLAIRPTVVALAGTGWDPERIRPLLGDVAGILAQCGVVMEGARIEIVDGPERLKYFLPVSARELARAAPRAKPTVYFVRDTLREDAYEAEAIGRSLARGWPEVADTVWITQDARDPAQSVAHELVHVLADSGEHADDPENLMHPRTAPGAVALTEAQCRRVVEVGTRYGLLTPR